MENLSYNVDSLILTQKINGANDSLSSDDDEVGTNKISFEEAKEKFRNLLSSIKFLDREEFCTYVYEEMTNSRFDETQEDQSFGILDVSKDLQVDPVIKLEEIATDIRALLPMNAVLPSEKIEPPKKGENSDCDPNMTIHVDEFLYDDVELEELVDEGKLKKYYCKDCGSKEVGILILISHSMSRDALYYIFKTQILTRGKKTILDIGSRLGAVLYGAYVYSNADRIIGVEMNKDFCDLQNDMIKKHQMTDRIEILHNRIEEVEEVVKAANIIVINNSFEFYLTEEEQINVWRFLKRHIMSKTILVIRPHLERTFANIDVGIDVGKWVKPYRVNEDDIGLNCSGYKFGVEETEYCDIGFYEVL